MTSFVDDSGNYIDYAGDLTLTKKAASIYDFKIKGDFSENFDLDNNSQIRKTLGYFGVNQIASPALSKVRFTMLRNGNGIKRGFIVIIGNDIDKIQCFFLSGNGNWFSLLKTNIRDFNYNKYSIGSLDVATKTPVDSGLIYPMVDWMFTGDKNEANFPALIYIGDYTNDETQRFPSLVPCAYLKTVFSEVLSQSGVKIAGDLVNDPIFNKILITPDRLNLQWPASAVSKSHADLYMNSTQVVGVTSGDIKFDTVLQRDNTGFSYDSTTGAYTVYQDCTLHIRLWINPSVVQPYTMVMYNLNSGISYSAIYRTVPFTGAVNLVGTADAWVNVKRGDKLVCKFNTTAPFNFNAGAYGTIEIEGNIFGTSLASNPGVTIPMSAIIPDMTALDLVKFVCNYFCCIAYFDDTNSVLTINKMDGISTWDDWSTYYSSHRTEYINIAKNNYIKFDEVEDMDIKNYNLNAATPYGGINIPTSFNIDTSQVISTLPFGPVKDRISPHTKWQMPSIPLAELTIDKSFAFTSVTTDGSGNAIFNAAAGTLGDGNNNYFFIYNLFFIATDQNFLSGYHLSSNATSSLVGSFRATPGASTTGLISTLKVNLIESKHRLLLVMTDYSVAGTMLGGATTWSTSSNSAVTTHTTFHKSWFNKAPNNDSSDFMRESLAMSNTQGSYYRNDCMGDLYFRTIKNIFNGPLIRARMILPESVFYGWDFSKMVYLSTPDITGYFFVNAINNYNDSRTDVEVELLRAK